eukprot:TRINITY_DN7662_c0_g3_i5.p1 TRINITY_DN7662_c0_g3~~TRINITY_DN7662_c0_g3_i5.p1  ORF type:complete len:161 (+),score=19.76 TRINITY_DN7662_c0_g3_i5:99-581(+)
MTIPRPKSNARPLPAMRVRYNASKAPLPLSTAVIAAEHCHCSHDDPPAKVKREAAAGHARAVQSIEGLALPCSQRLSPAPRAPPAQVVEAHRGGRLGVLAHCVYGALVHHRLQHAVRVGQAQELSDAAHATQRLRNQVLVLQEQDVLRILGAVQTNSRAQ